MIIKTEILCQFVGRDSFSALRRRWQKHLVLEAAEGKGISAERLRVAGCLRQGREARFAMPHCVRFSCCKNDFTASTAESSTDRWPVSHVLLRAGAVLPLSLQGSRCCFVFPSKTRRSFSAVFRVGVAVALKLR